MKRQPMRFDDKYWYRPDLTVTTSLLLPLSWLFSGVAALRRTLYKFNLIKTHRLKVPVIIVGNITAGGTGKTPCVIALANFLKANGYSPGIVTRGYGGKECSIPFAVNAETSADDAGDEAVLIARNTNCPLVVCVSRVAAAEMLIREFPECDVMISDDGLQHYALSRDIEIVVIDGARKFGNGRMLPAGPLREPVSRLRQADFVIVNGGMIDCDVVMTIVNDDFIPLIADENADAAGLKKKKIHAIAGIGNPSKFFNILRGYGYDIIEHAFPDHYKFTESDLNFGDDLPVVMTEKDAVKCEKFADERMWYLPASATFSGQFLHNVSRKLKEIT